MTEIVRVVAGLACCGGALVFAVLAWGMCAMAGRAAGDQDKGDG